MVIARVACVALALASLPLAMPSRASAQAAGAEAREARALFERGLEHAQNERWVEALEAFRESVARYDRPSTRLNMASVMLRLGRHREARDLMQSLLASEGLAAADRSQGEQLLARATEGIRSVEVIVEPSYAELVLGGQVVAGTGATRRLELDPGTHPLEVRADGHRTESRDLAAGVASVTVRLTPLPATLVVHTNVEAARIAVDGEAGGVGSAELELASGRHELVVTAEGHDRFERWLALDPGQVLEVQATLALTVRPSSGEIWQSEWFWIVGGIGVAVLAAVAIGLAVGLTGGPQYDGGSLGDVLMPR